VAALRRSDAARVAVRAFALSRGVILLVALFAALTAAPGGLNHANAERFDDPRLTHPIGGVGDVLLAPLARWDAVWYLRIADSGYAGDEHRTAFFPLYPLAVRAVGEIGGGGPGGRLVAAYLVSLAAFLGALYLFHRLVSLELGRRMAWPAVLLLSLFPASLFFGAPYSESLFLLLSVGAFYAARTDRWAWAGACAAGAAATRSSGILLLLPLAYLWWRGERDRRGAWLLLAPLGLGAYGAYLGAEHGDALAFTHVQEAWFREFAGPLGGVWDALVAAVEGMRQLLSGSREHVYFEQAGGDPYRVAAMNMMLFGFLVFAVVAAIGVVRRLPGAYGLWIVAALTLPLSFPVGPQPLMSLPRFMAVLFPIFMWLALVCEERRWTPAAAALFAMGLGLFTTQFAVWQFVA
jgi:hypothetical protein